MGRQVEQSELDTADRQRSALKALCPLAGGAGIHGGGSLPMQAGGRFRHSFPREHLFRVVQNSAGSHPHADQHEQPGCHSPHFIQLEVGAKHRRLYCTMLRT